MNTVWLINSNHSSLMTLPRGKWEGKLKVLLKSKTAVGRNVPGKQ